VLIAGDAGRHTVAAAAAAAAGAIVTVMASADGSTEGRRSWSV